MAKTRSKQPESSPTKSYAGMENAQAQMASGGSRFPILKLADGDRARFHFLTNGDALVGTKFHRFGEGMKTRHYVCLRVMTGGEEECRWCQQGHDEVGSRFAVWVFVHNIMHSKQADVGWQAQQVGEKILFREELKEPKLIKLAGGRKGEWWNQFVAAYTTNVDLQLHIYELYREGEQLETQYTLTTLKPQAIDPKILDSDEVKKLPTCEEVLREEATYGPGGAGSGSSLGTDEVLGGGTDDALPSATAAAEAPAEMEAVAEAKPDDDLI